MKLSQKIKDEIKELQKKYPESRSALIPALHMAQNEFGFLPRGVQSEIAVLFDINVNDVHSVVTFYDMFYEEPMGKHILHICKNLSCMLRGSDSLLEKLCEKLKVNPGETSADGEFTVIPSECLAACDRAPMILGDDKVFGPLKEDGLDAMLEEVRKSSGHICHLTGEVCRE